MTLSQIDPNTNKYLVLIYRVYSGHIAATIKEIDQFKHCQIISCKQSN